MSALRPQNVLDASALMLAAYQDDPVMPAGWTVLHDPATGKKLFTNSGNDGLLAGLVSDANAFVARRGDGMLAVVFEGTPHWTSHVSNAGAVAAWDPLYQGWSRLIEFARGQIASSPTGRILVVGHSQGGAMAEMFLERHASLYGDRLVGVAFASPGIDNPLASFGTTRLLRVEHTDDGVVDLAQAVRWGIATGALASTAFGPLVPVVLLKSVLTGAVVSVLGAYPDNEPDLRVARPEATIRNPFSAEHDRFLYEDTARKLFTAGFAAELLQNYATLEPVLLGNAGERRFGGTGRDVVVGGNGADALYGGGSRDLLGGWGGTDEIYGGEGDDWLDGQDGNDLLYGDWGADRLFGGIGWDRLRGDAGNDTLFGGGDSDSLFGGANDDLLRGEDGRDTLYGGDADSLFGGEGRDILRGGPGSDTLRGDGGDDILIGEGDADTLEGGDGTDTARYAHHSQFYRPIGTNALDFRLEATHFEEGTDRLIGIEWLEFQNQRVSVTSFLARFAPGVTTPPVVVVPPPEPVPVAPPLPPPSPTGLPRLYFDAQSFAEGNSGSRLVDLAVRLDKPSATPVTFSFWATAPTGTDAATPGVDSERIEARTVTIPAGQVVVRVPVRIFGDTRVEGNEVFLATVMNVVGAQLVQGPFADVERITIVDDDTAAPLPPPPPPRVVAGPVYLDLVTGLRTYFEGEDGGTTEFRYTVRKTGDLGVETRFSIAVEGWGAAPASAQDFAGGSFPSANVRLLPGQDSYTFRVIVQNDAVPEPNETFRVRLTPTSPGVALQNDTALGVILNDDGTTLPPPGGGTVHVALHALDAVKAEGTNVFLDDDGRIYPASQTPFSFEVVRSGDLGQLTRVRVSWPDGRDATPQALHRDLSQPGQTVVTFNPGQDRATFTVGVWRDDTNEPDEPFTVSIRPHESFPAVVIDKARAQGVILNDDKPAPPLVTVRPVIVRETEADQTIMPRVELAHAMPVPVTMDYVVGHAAAAYHTATDGEDFVVATGRLTIPAGALFAEIPVVIRGDRAAEGTEAVVVRLSDPVNGYFGRSVDAWDSGVIVLDSDTPTPVPMSAEEFAAVAVDLGTLDPYSYREIFARRDAASPFHAYRFTLESAQVVAKSGWGPAFLFDAAGRLLDADVDRFDSSQVGPVAGAYAGGAALPAGTDHLLLDFGAGLGGDGRFALASLPGDREPPMVTLRTFEDLSESIGAYVYVELSHAVTTDVQVTLAYRSLTATVGGDIRPDHFTVTIPAGDRSHTVYIAPLQDSVFEGTEQFEVAMVSVVGAVLPNGAPDFAVTLAVTDDDPDPLPRFSVEALDADRAEGNAGSAVPFTFRISRPEARASAAATVAWTVEGSGASPAGGADFAGAALPRGTAAFAAGETAVTITVPVQPDRFSEQDETIRVVLSQPSTGFGIAFGTATGVIRNDDGRGSGSRLPDGTLAIATSYALGPGDRDVLLSGVSAADLIGNDIANRLGGNNNNENRAGGGNDSVFGYAGHDRLEGQAGADMLYGGAGNDTLLGGTESDHLEGGTATTR